MSRYTDARKIPAAQPCRIDPDISEVLHLIGVLERRAGGTVPADVDRHRKDPVEKP